MASAIRPALISLVRLSWMYCWTRKRKLRSIAALLRFFSFGRPFAVRPAKIQKPFEKVSRGQRGARNNQGDGELPDPCRNPRMDECVLRVQPAHCGAYTCCADHVALSIYHQAFLHSSPHFLGDKFASARAG